MLWYDEMTIYSIASKSFPAGMLHADAHRFLLFPLYYLVYHIWITVFGNSDFIIRLMSVFFDVLSVSAAYFAGITLGRFFEKDEKFCRFTGLIYSLFYAVNSSFIYYAQEAKFYSLTFLLVNLFIIFWLKFLKEQNSRNFLYFILANIALIYTYTSQILLTLIVFTVSILFFAAEHKLKRNFKYLAIYPFIYFPVLIFLFFIKNYFSGNFDAVVFDKSFILLALQNYFTPVLAGVQNNILNFGAVWLKGMFTLKFWIFVIFPVLFMVSMICSALKREKNIRFIFLVPVLYIAFHIAASNFTNYKVLVRYTLMCLPFLLISAAAGACCLKSNKLKKILIILYSLVSLLGIFSLNGALRIERPDGYKILAHTLQQNGISPEYDFILPIREDLLDKYFKITGEKLSLYKLNSPEAQKTYLKAGSGTKEALKNYFLSDDIPYEFSKYIEENLLKNNNIVIITDRSISMFTNEQVKYITASGNFDRVPLQFLRLSRLNNDLVATAAEKFRLKKHINVKNWEIFVFGV